MLNKTNTKYSDDFKRGIVSLYKNGRTLRQIHAEYGVSLSAAARWVKAYSEVQIDEDTILTTQQIKQLQKEKLRLQEENDILKKALAIFTPNSKKE
jgi:transposase